MAAVTTDRDLKKRAREVANAMASVRMEGLEPSEETKALFQRYVDGDLTSRELDLAFQAYLDREYRPLHLPRNQRS